MSIDIVCGYEINEHKALKTTYGDRPFYFCSKICRGNFVQNPLRYIDKSHSVSSTEGSPKLTATGQRIYSKS